MFLVMLTVGFVYEMAKGALKFTDQRSGLKRNVIIDQTSNPFGTNPYIRKVLKILVYWH